MFSESNAASEPRHPPGRTLKFRQAAFVYLHVGLLYEFSVVAMWRQGLLPTERGPIGVWLIMGAAVVALVVWGLLVWQSVWFCRIIWAVHSVRLPALISGAFFPSAISTLPQSFYLTALIVVLINLWMLVRAGWDL